MKLLTLRYLLFFLLTIYSLIDVAVNCQNLKLTLNPYSYNKTQLKLSTFVNNKTSVILNFKTKPQQLVYYSDEKSIFKETVYIGFGIFTNSAYYSYIGGYTKLLNNYLSISFGINIYEKFKNINTKPPPSIDLSVLYTKTFFNNKLILSTGGGLTVFFMTAFGGIIKTKLDYNVFENLYLGSEVQCKIIRFEIYEAPLIMINLTLIF